MLWDASAKNHPFEWQKAVWADKCYSSVRVTLKININMVDMVGPESAARSEKTAYFNITDGVSLTVSIVSFHAATPTIHAYPTASATTTRAP